MRGRIVLFGLLCAYLVWGHGWGMAQTDTRIFALIIAEEQYQDPSYGTTPPFEQQEAYLELLRQRGGVIRRRSYTNLTKEQIRKALTTLSTQSLLFLFHGQVTRSPTTNRVYLLPVDAISGDIASMISIAEINQWMQGIPEQIVLLDAYTQDENLMAYYANPADAEILGTSALISIKPIQATGTSLAEALAAVFGSDATDENHDRRLDLREVYQASLDQFDWPGLFVPTGQMNAVLLRLPSRLFVLTDPPGAHVWVNGEEKGETPYIQEPLPPGEYRIRLEKEGFYRPEENLVRLTSARGEGGNVEVNLEPIKIRGKAHDAQGRGVVPTIVQIEGTDYAVETDPNGEFVFERAILEAGKRYTLKASAGDGIFVGEQTFVYQGFEDIVQNILMRQRPWLEVALERFQQGKLQDAADKFQLAVKENYKLPTLPADFAQMAFEYTEAWIQQQPEFVPALLAAAQLAEQLDRRSEAKRYWLLAKRRAEEDSQEYLFASQRLKALTPWKKPVLIGSLILLGLLAISAAYFTYRYRQNRQ